MKETTDRGLMEMRIAAATGHDRCRFDRREAGLVALYDFAEQLSDAVEGRSVPTLLQAQSTTTRTG